MTLKFKSSLEKKKREKPGHSAFLLFLFSMDDVSCSFGTTFACTFLIQAAVTLITTKYYFSVLILCIMLTGFFIFFIFSIFLKTCS